jgi:hypothetical protein
MVNSPGKALHEKSHNDGQIRHIPLGAQFAGMRLSLGVTVRTTTLGRSVRIQLRTSTARCKESNHV